MSFPRAEAVRERRASLDRATDALEIHASTADGGCAGCAGPGGRFVGATGCAHRERARSVIETLGVEEDAWDTSVTAYNLVAALV